MILYDKIGAGPHPCHWCGDKLVWAVASGTGIVADHLDGDTQDNDPENLVPSCRGCNANRSTHGRRQPKTCEHCGVAFIAKGNTHHSDRRFCSLSCAGAVRAAIMRERPTLSAHGTRARYTGKDKCRCDECRAANAAYTQKLIQDRAERGDDAKPCEHCGTVFAPPRRRSRFCSRTCARQAGC